MTHILNFKVILANKKLSSDIERIIKISIWRNNNFSSNATDSPIFWNMTKDYYYTNMGFIYDDVFIKRSAYALLKRIVDDTRIKHPVYGNDWQLSYNIKNNLSIGTHTFFL